MVMSRNIDFDDVIEMTEGEASVMDPAFSDEDIVESGQALEMMENTQPNPRNSERIPWQALRLPGARTSERGRIERFVMAPLRKLVPGYSPSSEIRSSPFAYLISAKLWTQYINNMDAQDFGAELNAAVSMEERASLYLFAEEWRNDVAHTRFKTRLIDDPSVNVGNEVAKGQIVYDVLTGAIRQRGGQANTQYNRMFRLAMDILQSIRMRYYNYYSVNLLHRDEGSNVYEEFLSRYVPMEAHEVAIISEIEGGIAAHGRAYASQTTSPVTDPVQNFALMQRAVESYSIGDTRTARSALGLLLGAPISYRSSVAYSVNADVYGRPQIVREGGLVVARIANKLKESAKKGRNKVFIKMGNAKDGSEVEMKVGNNGVITNENDLKGATFIQVDSLENPTPINYAVFSDAKEVSVKYLPYAQWQDDIAKLSIAAESAQQTSSNTSRRRQNVRGNPVRHNMPLMFREDGRGEGLTGDSPAAGPLALWLNKTDPETFLAELFVTGDGDNQALQDSLKLALAEAYNRQYMLQQQKAPESFQQKAYADAQKIEDLISSHTRELGISLAEAKDWSYQYFLDKQGLTPPSNERDWKCHLHHHHQCPHHQKMTQSSILASELTHDTNQIGSTRW